MRIWRAGGSVTASSAWAARGSGATVGQSKLITDIGPAEGTLMRWDGTYWKLVAPTYIVFLTTLVTGIANTNEQILQQALLPAGILRAGRSFAVRALFAKNGTTDASSASNIRLGTAGTIADAAIHQPSALIAANRSVATEIWLFASSSTNLRTLGSQSVAAQPVWAMTPTTQSYPKDVTVPDIDANALYLSASIQMGGSTNLSQLPHLLLELFP